MALTKITGSGLGTLTSDVDAQGSSGATLKLTSTDTTGADTELLGQIDFVSSDSSTGSAGTQARIKGVYEDNGDSTGIAFLAGASTGSGTPTISEVMRIRHEGRVGINRSSPATTLDVNGTVTITGTASRGLTITSAATAAGQGDADAVYDAQDTEGGGTGSHIFKIGGSEFARINASGEILVGASTFSSSSNMKRISSGTIDCSRSSTGGVTQITFQNPNGLVGFISTSGTTTSYSTSSDYRLKQDVKDMTGAINRVKQLAPKRFNFIADADTTVDGFLAHEAQAVVPESVTGTKDEVDDDDNPVMQGIDQSKLVPLLTAALKESIAKIEALEARVKTLEDA